jgi:hypothetical protein
MSQADFPRNIEKHNPSVAKYAVGWETVNPTDPQIVAFVRDYSSIIARYLHKMTT